MFLAQGVQAQMAGASNGAQVVGPMMPSENDRRAPADYGFGPGVKPGLATAAARTMSALFSDTAAVPSGGPTAHVTGLFGPPVTWPLIPIHALLTADGRVLTYGTDDKGLQGAEEIYDIWDPTKGTDASSHLTLPNMAFTDIFCSAQTVLSSTGKVLVVGGEVTVNKQRGYSTAQVEIFDPDTNDLKSNGAMTYARWYPTAIGLPNGEVAILGGRLAPNTEPAIVPEVYNPMTGWRTLPGAASADAFGSPNYQLWYYPRAFLTLAGDLFVYAYNGKTFSLTTEGSGSITQLALKGIPGSSAHPDVPYASGLVLSVRANRKVQVIGMRTSPPTITTVADIDQVRYWSSGTALPDGTVAVTGGSSGYNTLDGVAYNATLWNSSTGKWTTGAAAAKARLYHSIALLLPDATVLTGGGGAPGPVNQLNAEIYYPPYLFKTDGSGEPAARPTIVSAPTTVRVGQKFTVAVGSRQTINKVTMMKLGSDTHSLDPDQRIPFTVFTQSGDSVSVSLSINKNNALPGYYMLFVLQNNVPSIASFVQVTL